LEPVRKLQSEIIPILSVEWVNPEMHALAVNALLTSNRRQLSLVDTVSFAVMRVSQIDTALAIDRHFTEQGFTCLP
ncbi:MAG: VapC toxin family PIN domain ribonuclease, partial [Chloroflexota bacterium]|nr:VapC toxin family PIN domain ribonuclease [Chloroflexota bacterium]